ncbi:unnamed protein product [Ceutorhynchus assimilis]|uniref:Uncharacterized protein n=1 Tax=Ceutorhynchus assimilis TaxID=467358 RepID=A0A9N9MC01_9CUCU|nr:unnamed protein product [Ceutorhynchus assimilis]
MDQRKLMDNANTITDMAKVEVKESIKEVPLLKDEFKKLQSEVNEIKENLNKAKSTYAEVTKIINEAELIRTSVNKLEKKVEDFKSQDKENLVPAIDEISERAKRSLNIITQNTVYEIVSDMSTRQDTFEDRLTNVEEKLTALQEQLDLLPDLIASRIQTQQEKIEQRRNFLHPESAAGLQQARSVPPACNWPGTASMPNANRPSPPATTQS